MPGTVQEKTIPTECSYFKGTLFYVLFLWFLVFRRFECLFCLVYQGRSKRKIERWSKNVPRILGDWMYCQTFRSIRCNFLWLAFIFQLQTPTQTTEQRRSQPVVVVQPLNSNQQVIPNALRGNTGSGPANQNVAPQPVRGGEAIVRSIPGERLIGVTVNLFDHKQYSFSLVCQEKKETDNEEKRQDENYLVP